MSLSKRRAAKTKTISIVGSETDIRTLGDAIQQAATMFNIDLDVDNKDLPQRITIREKNDPEAVDYPRTAKALRNIAKELSKGPVEGTHPVHFGSFDWKFAIPSVSGRDVPDVVRVMQSISEGQSVGGLPAMMPGKHYAGYDVMTQMDDAIAKKPENMIIPGGTTGGLFKRLKPNWVYLQTVDIAPLRSRKAKGKGKHDSKEELRALEEGRMAEVDDKVKNVPGLGHYPADLGIVEAKGKGRTEATQGYASVFRGDLDYDLSQKLEISRKTWDTFIRKMPADMLSKELRNKPKTVGDMLEVFFAYNVASTMKLKNAAVKPIGPGRAKIFTELMDDKGGDPPGPGQPPARPALGTKVLYSAIVVGTGKYIPDSHSVSTLGQAKVPGWN